RAVDGDLGLASTHPGVVLFVVAIGQARIMVPVLRWYRRFSTALGQGQLKHWPPQRLGPEWSEVWVAALTPRCIPAFIGPRAPPAGC
ncbi:MAG: hypothetical protein ACE5GE_09545, partial [Phycisphaerae bacterium]